MTFKEPIYKILEWDSHFFNLNIGSLHCQSVNEAENFIQQIQKNSLDLLYTIIPDDNSTFKSSLLGNLVDIKYLYETNLSEVNNPNSHISIILETSPKLYDLAYQSGYESRFKKDNKFKTGEFERFYKIWIDNSINKSIADYVLGYYDDKELKGFISLKINGEKATIGLFAVDINDRGTGIGRQLIEAAKYYSFKNGAKKLFVATQKYNHRACSFYQKNGFILNNIETIYHKWFI